MRPTLFVIQTGDKRPRRDAIRYDEYSGGNASAPPALASAPVQPPPQISGKSPTDLASLLHRYDSGAAAALSIPGRDAPAAYFVLRTLSSETLLLAVKRCEWVTPAADAIPALAAAGGRPTFLSFSIVHTCGFQGTAEVVGPPVPVGGGHNLSSAEGAGELVSIPLRWHRTCALPFPATASLFVPQGDFSPPLPVARSGDWQELPDRVGRALMLLLFESPPEIVSAINLGVSSDHNSLGLALLCHVPRYDAARS